MVSFSLEALPERGNHLHEPAIRTSQLSALSSLGTLFLIMSWFSPEYVKPVQDYVPARVLGKEGAREAVAHLEEGLEQLV
jgi:hypothetical protein